jgi:hypothetical protein
MSTSNATESLSSVAVRLPSDGWLVENERRRSASASRTVTFYQERTPKIPPPSSVLLLALYLRWNCLLISNLCIEMIRYDRPECGKDLHSRQGVMHFRLKGKRAKIRFVPVDAAAQRMIEDYLAWTGHRNDVEGAIFRPANNNPTGRLDRHLDPASVNQNIVRKYGLETGLSAEVMDVCIRCAPRQQQTLYRMIPILPGSRVAGAR